LLELAEELLLDVGHLAQSTLPLGRNVHKASWPIGLKATGFWPAATRAKGLVARAPVYMVWKQSMVVPLAKRPTNLEPRHPPKNTGKWVLRATGPQRTLVGCHGRIAPNRA